MKRLPIEIVRALVAWEKNHGRFWKADLRSAWATGRYGLVSAEISGPLQHLRNTDAAWLNKQVSMADLKAQLHAHDLRVAAEALIKQICPAGFPDPHYFARQEITKLIGLIQQSPVAYDGTV
jgi:hypothetical protein